MHLLNMYEHKQCFKKDIFRKYQTPFSLEEFRFYYRYKRQYLVRILAQTLEWNKINIDYDG